jgi:hypothetical protein
MRREKRKNKLGWRRRTELRPVEENKALCGGEEIKLTRQRRIKPRSSEEQSLGGGKISQLRQWKRKQLSQWKNRSSCRWKRTKLRPQVKKKTQAEDKNNALATEKEKTKAFGKNKV